MTKKIDFSKEQGGRKVAYNKFNLLGIIFIISFLFSFSFISAIPNDSDIDLEFNYATNYSTIPTVNNSDYLDGQHGSYYLDDTTLSEATVDSYCNNNGYYNASNPFGFYNSTTLPPTDLSAYFYNSTNVSHDDTTGFEADEHINWTNATVTFVTSADAYIEGVLNVGNGTSGASDPLMRFDIHAVEAQDPKFFYDVSELRFSMDDSFYINTGNVLTSRNALEVYLSGNAQYQAGQIWKYMTFGGATTLTSGRVTDTVMGVESILQYAGPYFGTGISTNNYGFYSGASAFYKFPELTNYYAYFIGDLDEDITFINKWGFYNNGSGANNYLGHDDVITYFGNDYDTEMYWDANDFIINTTTGNVLFKNDTGWGEIEYGNAIDHTYLTNATDKEAYELVDWQQAHEFNVDGSYNYSAWGECYVQGETTDYSRPEIEYYEEEKCSSQLINLTDDAGNLLYEDIFYENEEGIIEKRSVVSQEWTQEECSYIETPNGYEEVCINSPVCSIKTYNRTIYPYTKQTEGTNVGCKQVMLQKANAYKNELLKPIDTTDYGTIIDATNGIMAENIWTQSKVVEDGVIYIDKLKDKDKLKVKEDHYAYELIDGYETLNLEERVVALEGAVNEIFTILCDKNILKKEDGCL